MLVSVPFLFCMRFCVCVIDMVCLLCYCFVCLFVVLCSLPLFVVLPCLCVCVFVFFFHSVINCFVCVVVVCVL